MEAKCVSKYKLSEDQNGRRYTRDPLEVCASSMQISDFWTQADLRGVIRL